MRHFLRISIDSIVTITFNINFESNVFTLKDVITISSKTHRDKDKKMGAERNRGDNCVIRFSLLQINDSGVVGI